MNQHGFGCKCPECEAERNGYRPGVYAYAAPVPRCIPQNPFHDVVTMYMAQTETEELREIRQLREEVRSLAKTCDGMRKLVERFVSKGKAKK